MLFLTHGMAIMSQCDNSAVAPPIVSGPLALHTPVAAMYARICHWTA